jgi:hypothetical protein
MKATKIILTAIAIGALIASSASARTAVVRTNSRISAVSNHRFHRHHSNVFFGFGLGYPYGYGYYPYYAGYPYGYGYYRTPAYDAVDDSTVVAVQRRLARAGYYRGPIDGVAGNETRRAIRAYERAHGLRVDGLIDPQLLRTMGLA